MTTDDLCLFWTFWENPRFLKFDSKKVEAENPEELYCYPAPWLMCADAIALVSVSFLKSGLESGRVLAWVPMKPEFFMLRLDALATPKETAFDPLDMAIGTWLE